MLTETVFSWPGLGRLMVDSIKSKDIPMVLGSVIFLAIMFTVVNLAVDIIYAFVDRELNHNTREVGAVHGKETSDCRGSGRRPALPVGRGMAQIQKEPAGMIGMYFILALVIIAIATIIIDAVTGKSIYLNYVVKQDLRGRLQGPSLAHPLLDEFGRDMLLRMLWAVRYSLFMGTVASSFHVSSAVSWELSQVLRQDR